MTPLKSEKFKIHQTEPFGHWVVVTNFELGEKKDAEQLKKQILEWQEFYNFANSERPETEFETGMKNFIKELKEKAEKADGIIKEYNARWQHILKLEQENKELKEAKVYIIKSHNTLQELYDKNKEIVQKVRKYQTVINEAKNKAQSPLEHHALQLAESTIKEILEDKND